MAEDACKQGRFSIFTDNLEGIVPSFLQHCRGKIIGMNDQHGQCFGHVVEENMASFISPNQCSLSCRYFLDSKSALSLFAWI